MKMDILEVKCRGTPREIGIQHGRTAKTQIGGSITFYEGLFRKYAGKEWEDILLIAEKFAVQINQKWPRYYQEIEGVALGSGHNIGDIVALNVRTEIAFGLLKDGSRTDGCTTVSLGDGAHRFLGQNWDWMEEQKDNLILLTIEAQDLPAIKMMTEAGIIGKIGLNDCGVGVCLNAIRAQGYDEMRLPVHLALRLALESTSARIAAKRLEQAGIAAAAHILVADREASIGIEVTSKTFVRLEPDHLGRILHTNHLLKCHDGVNELPDIDSFSRMKRIAFLTDEVAARHQDLTFDQFEDLFDDHDGSPVSICRFQEGCSEDATLFSISMDLEKCKAVVKLGKPCQAQHQYTITFGADRKS